MIAQVTKTDSGWRVEHPQWKGGASFLSHNDAEEYAKKLTTAIDFVDAFSKKLMFRSRARIRLYTNNGWDILLK